MPKAVRARGHERLAGWLARIEARVPEADARIGTHLERAHGTAVELGRPAPELRAARRPLPRSASPRPGAARIAAATSRARSRSSRAPAELLAGDDRARAELLPALAAALIEAGTLDRAAEVARGRARARRAARPRARPLARRRRARAPAAPSGGPTRSTRTRRWPSSDRAVAALRDLGDDLGLARAHILGCEVLWLKGSPETGYRHAERAVHHARRARSGFEVDTGVSLHGVGARRQRGPGLRGDAAAAARSSARSPGASPP